MQILSTRPLAFPNSEADIFLNAVLNALSSPSISHEVGKHLLHFFLIIYLEYLNIRRYFQVFTDYLQILHQNLQRPLGQ